MQAPIQKLQTTLPQNMNYKSKNIKIGTWNLCLGLRNKKDSVSKILIQNKLDIVCLQETDMEQNYPHNILSFKGYKLSQWKELIKSQNRDVHQY